MQDQPAASEWQSLGGFESLVAEFYASAHSLAVSYDRQVGELQNSRASLVKKVLELRDENARLNAALEKTSFNEEAKKEEPGVIFEAQVKLPVAAVKNSFGEDLQAADAAKNATPLSTPTLPQMGPAVVGQPDLQAIQVLQNATPLSTPTIPQKIPEGSEGASAQSDLTGRDSQNQRLTVKQARAAMLALDQSPHLHSRSKTEVIPGIVKVKKKRKMFTDVDEMKKQVRHAILQPYNVSDFYNPDKMSARIAKNEKFEMACLAAVSLNSLWIAFDADMNGTKDAADKHFMYHIVEYCFFAFFTGEITVRFAAFRRKIDCFRDFWFNFDLALVLLMFVDALLPLISSGGIGFNTSIIRLARLVKISRMGRMAVLLKRWPEMAVLIQGIGIACRSVLSTLFLLVIMVYVFAVTLRLLTMDTDVGQKYYRSVLYSMKVLILYASMPDAVNMVDHAGAEHVLIGVVVVIFFAATGLTLLNMLIGVLCEVIGVVAEMEKESGRTQVVKDHLVKVLSDSGVDADVDGFISKHEFQNMLLNSSVVMTLRDMGVDPVGLIDFIDYIFGADDGSDDKGLTFDKLVELMCELGGTNKATVKDVVDMRQVVIRQLATIEEALERHVAYVQSSALFNKTGLMAPPAPDDIPFGLEITC